jgi:hypothetical protein
MQLLPTALVKTLGIVAMAGQMLCAHAADIVTRAEDLGTLSAPVTLTYSHAFNDTNPALDGLQLDGVQGTVYASDFFYDDYAFQIGGTSFSSITATIDLGSIFQITNLRVRLYQGTLQTNNGLMQGWSPASLTSSSGTGNVQVINPIELAPGSYVLEVRGNIVGTSGGAYSGLMNLASVTPVPEPAAMAMMLAGLGLLRITGRRRAA